MFSMSERTKVDLAKFGDGTVRRQPTLVFRLRQASVCGGRHMAFGQRQEEAAVDVRQGQVLE